MYGCERRLETIATAAAILACRFHNIKDVTANAFREEFSVNKASIHRILHKYRSLVPGSITSPAKETKKTDVSSPNFQQLEPIDQRHERFPLTEASRLPECEAETVSENFQIGQDGGSLEAHTDTGGAKTSPTELVPLSRGTDANMRHEEDTLGGLGDQTNEIGKSNKKRGRVKKKAAGINSIIIGDLVVPSGWSTRRSNRFVKKEPTQEEVITIYDPLNFGQSTITTKAAPVDDGLDLLFFDQKRDYMSSAPESVDVLFSLGPPAIPIAQPKTKKVKTQTPPPKTPDPIPADDPLSFLFS
jgi:hypothetical protein